MKLNAATCTDGYKLSHAPMYADGTNKVYNNLTPRSDRIYRANSATKFYDGRLVWIGAQGAVQEVKEMWDDFFRSDKETVVKKFARRMAGYLGGFDPAVKVIAELHDVGYLPLQIKSLPEGAKVKFGTPVMTVTNTLPQFYWLVNYLETVISALTWKPATAATIAAEYKAICEHYAELTGTDAFTVSIQCHDFSMRGMSGPEDSARTGFGHLTQFIGTDSLPAMDYAEAYYDANPDSLIAISVPATEHAVMTSNILFIEQQLAAGEKVNGKTLQEWADALGFSS
jgi:nicotinamide phosphoribosyltransferase